MSITTKTKHYTAIQLANKLYKLMELSRRFEIVLNGFTIKVTYDIIEVTSHREDTTFPVLRLNNLNDWIDDGYDPYEIYSDKELKRLRKKAIRVWAKLNDIAY